MDDNDKNFKHTIKPEVQPSGITLYKIVPDDEESQRIFDRWIEKAERNPRPWHPFMRSEVNDE